MSLVNWLAFIAIIQVVHFLGTWKFYVAAGKKPWQAAVPLYNAMCIDAHYKTTLVVDPSFIYSYCKPYHVSGFMGRAVKQIW